ncbi:MAG: hypothetical protein DMD96_00620 [Candidatus Rokuibacteriota bacterium]|nr:MAG: hypothetical protein DMD96_00620 [Candidatus Rokubacteria bacterium]
MRTLGKREATRDRESLNRRLTDWWAYLLLGGVGLILGTFIIDLVGIDLHVVLSGAILAVLTVWIFWLLRRARKSK